MSLWRRHRVALLVALVTCQLLIGWLAFVVHTTRPPNHSASYTGPGPPLAQPPPRRPPPTGAASPADPEQEPDAPPPPPVSEPIDLTSWKLTIPERSSKGTAASVSPADNAPPWLVRAPNGSLEFWAPSAGATTPNSTHVRTELDSLHNFTAGTSPRALSASVSVTQAPEDTQDIIVGQIHGADDISSMSFVMLHYRAGTVEVVVKQKQGGSASDKYPLIANIPLGARFDYALVDEGNGNLLFAARYGSAIRTATITIPAPFRGAIVRFQAGDYQQGDTTKSRNAAGGKVTFFALSEGPFPL